MWFIFFTVLINISAGFVVPFDIFFEWFWSLEISHLSTGSLAVVKDEHQDIASCGIFLLGTKLILQFLRCLVLLSVLLTGVCRQTPNCEMYRILWSSIRQLVQACL